MKATVINYRRGDSFRTGNPDIDNSYATTIAMSGNTFPESAAPAELVPALTRAHAAQGNYRESVNLSRESARQLAKLAQDSYRAAVAESRKAQLELTGTTGQSPLPQD